ncbi:TolC family protein [Neolewinella antarctica]|uniref:Outer membrane protein TolC n=1 Tax=Neolewinella antarctica TaxID=442734 RepID=A0ABX0XCE9_9BACT|nr:TolC family protein [Neolewinella antarctica]NJC26948.1 outer membrane protein TolC [Neolewinella antarctica]
MTRTLLFICLFSVPFLARAQVQAMDREQCVAYALANAPDLRNARLEDSIAELNNQILLSAWKPIVALTGAVTNNWKQQVTLFPDFNNPGETSEVVLGQKWLSNAGVTVNQLIYSPEVIRDRNLQRANLEAARLVIEEQELQLKARVSTAFYQTLLFTERITLARADIERLERNLRDARLLYENGINDKVDYKRATIALNQAKANLATGLLGLDSRMAELKSLMGYPENQPLDLTYDYERYSLDVTSDSLLDLEIRERPEIRALRIRQQQQDLNTTYLRRSWQPTVSAQGGYLYNYLASNLGDLYGQKYPAGVASLNVNVPLFNGGRRFHQVELATVLRLGLDYELEALRQEIQREFAVADNDYRSGRLNFLIAEENVELAREIYEVIDLQYREGIKPFLEVVIAESDLRTSQNRALNALIDALIARVELQRVTATL